MHLFAFSRATLINLCKVLYVSRYLLQGFDVDPIHHMLACSGSDQRVRIWSLDYTDPVCILSPPGDHDQFPQLVQSLAWSRASERPLTLAVACGHDVHIFACGPT